MAEQRREGPSRSLFTGDLCQRFGTASHRHPLQEKGSENCYCVVSTQRGTTAVLFLNLCCSTRGGQGNTAAQLESVGSTTAVVEMGRGEKATLLPTRRCTAAPDAFAGRFYDYPVYKRRMCMLVMLHSQSPGYQRQRTNASFLNVWLVYGRALLSCVDLPRPKCCCASETSPTSSTT